MTVTVPRHVRDAIVAHARHEAPHECCGLLVGRGTTIEDCVPVRNISHTPGTRYEIDPAAHIATRRRLRGTHRAVVGCYHSHPSSPAVPSETDLADASYPEFVWIIVSLADPENPQLAAYQVADRRSSRLHLVGTS